MNDLDLTIAALGEDIGYVWFTRPSGVFVQRHILRDSIRKPNRLITGVCQNCGTERTFAIWAFIHDKFPNAEIIECTKKMI